jgi:outer membrane protein OmpA-like peptidoglycan-associated protein
MTKLCRLIILFWLLLLLPFSAWSIPTQYGDTGLLSQPTADTLNAGNICVGLWSNVSDGPATSATVVPFSITLGLGSFVEFYGSYPNLLFNDKEEASGRGFVSLGSKVRVLGRRSSLFKVAIDGQLQRQISIDPVFDGLVNYQGRLITSLANEQFGIHAYGSYRNNEDPDSIPAIDYENQIGFGGGIEYFPTQRLRLIVEAESYAEKLVGTDRATEVTGGFQYFISPHLTFSLGVGIGLTDQSPDLRVLAGFSTCQGIGSYSLNVLEEETEEQIAETLQPEQVKVLKLKALTPLIAFPAGTDTGALSGVDATFNAKPEPVSKIPQSVTAPVIKPPVVTPTPIEVPAPETSPIPAADLEVAVPEDSMVLVEPAENIMAPGTIPPPSVNFPDSPSLAGIVTTTTPALKKPTKTKLYRKFVLPEFTFQFGQYKLTKTGRAVLSEIANELSADGKWSIVRLDGHTDSTGPELYNDRLSLQRAIEYAMYLVKIENIDPSRIFVKGFGEKAPLSTNAEPSGRKLNRRVEVLLLVQSEDGT